MQPAPLYTDIARAPEGGQAHWLTCVDGVRIRVAHWAKGNAGTVLLFPGRTEYIEKYGPAAGELAKRGYASIIIDWRGQGLADRQLTDRSTGHVEEFADYQHDVAAMLGAVQALDLPQPYYLMTHSMGGCIGLRALIEGLPVAAAAFSAPMWGMLISAAARPFAWSLAATSRAMRQGHRYAPGTGPLTYVALAPYEGNVLTTDPEMYAFMKEQVAAHPDLALGGPSLHWLHEALLETRALRAMPSPAVPVLTALGTRERVVDTRAVHERMGRWRGGTLDLVEGAEHEVIMETPELRTRFFDDAAKLFAQHHA